MNTAAREHVAGWVNRFPEVIWDRMTHADAGETDEYAWPEQVWVFGWIARDDGRTDFLVLQFFRDADADWSSPFTSTSSARYSAEFADRVGRGDEHGDCQRVEHLLGDLVDRCVRL